MKNTLIKIDISTYLFFLLAMMAGYIKSTIIIFIIILLHEFGHVISTYLCGYKVLGVTLYPFGGYTIIDKKINSSINKDIFIALSGIFMQLFILFLVNIFSSYFVSNTYNMIIYYNNLIMIFNLLPIIPLDGFKLVNLFINKFYSFRSSYFISFFIGLIFYIIFIFYVFSLKINSAFIIGFLCFNIFKYLKDYKYIYNRFLLERYLSSFEYRKIINSTSKIEDLRLETLHYFKENDKYSHEKSILAKRFDRT